MAIRFRPKDGILIDIIPTFLFYFITSKFMLTGMTAGAVKE